MNQEFANISVAEKRRILQIDPDLVPFAEKWIEVVLSDKKFEWVKGGVDPNEKNNIFGLDETMSSLDYSDKKGNLLVREKDGTMLLNIPVDKLQRRAVKMILGQLAKKLMSADLTGIKLPVFLFLPKTYLHQ